MTACAEFKKNCKPGKLVSNERTRIADTTAVYIDGYVYDITGKKQPNTIFKFTNQNTYKITESDGTDSTGRTSLSGLVAGIYTLKINCLGYKTIIVEDLVFGPGDVRKIIIDLGENCCTRFKLTEIDDKLNLDEWEEKMPR